MINLVIDFINKKYIPLNMIRLSKRSLISNYKYINAVNKNVKIAPVLKSNAYGHGLIEIAKILDELNCPMFCVDSLYEAYKLLNAKIKTPILIMGYVHPNSLKVKKLPFSYAVFSSQQLEAINKYQKGAKIHLKVDTGMHRLGIPFEEFQSFINNLKKYKNIKIEGLMSHIAYQEDLKNDLSKSQISKFNKALYICRKNGIDPKWIHFGATKPTLSSQLKSLSRHTNMARIGLSLYGVGPKDKTAKLKPVLTLTSQIVQIKKLYSGEMVGYSGTFKATKEILMGVLPIGYNDGVDLRLSNKGFVRVKNTNCPIIGAISMNITTVDLTGVKNPKVGDSVTIFSSDNSHINSIFKSAQFSEAIPYELLVHLNENSIKRELVP